jgi:hypothetical protein
MCAFAQDYPVRWQVAHGHLWSNHHWFITEPNRARDGFGRYQLDGLLEGKRITVPDGKESDQGESVVISKLLGRLRTMGMWSVDFPSVLNYDYLPVSEDEVRLFVLSNMAASIQNKIGPNGVIEAQKMINTKEDAFTPRWTLTVYQTRRIFQPRFKEWDEEAYVKVESLPVSFREPFQIIAKESTYWFVTASGKLYRTGAHRMLTGQRDIEPVWNDAARPISHFVTDADADRTFLFCKPAKEGEPGVFFELGPKPEPKPYDLSKVKPSKADEPLKGVLERARFLADQKLLKNPEPPKDEKKP